MISVVTLLYLQYIQDCVTSCVCINIMCSHMMLKHILLFSPPSSARCLFYQSVTVLLPPNCQMSDPEVMCFRVVAKTIPNWEGVRGL